MPRPAGVDLHQLFGPNDPPDGWEEWVDYRMYFVHGIFDALGLVGKRPTSKEFMPFRAQVAAARAESRWEDGLAAETWAAFSNQAQVKRFVSVRNNLFTTAANGMLAIELLLARNGYKGDIYRDSVCYIVPQDSHITGLTHPLFDQVCASVSAEAKQPWQPVLFRDFGQPKELFDEVVSGRLITRRLAQDLLRLIKKHVPDFDGEVSSDFTARRETLETLRREALLEDGKNGQKQYRQRITGAQHELYAR
jgi:hypothetical protein